VSAERKVRRKVTAREAAERLGISTRTVQRVAAEPRADYERRARERGEQILRWRDEGLLWREIADLLNLTVNAAMKAGGHAKKHRNNTSQQAPQDRDTTS